MEEIALANAAIGMLEILVPRIESLANSGNITVEQQKSVRDKYLALRANMDSAFTGPGWKVE